jgi:hypothetical protein
VIGKALAGAIAVVLVVPAIAALAAFGVGTDAQTCISSVVATAGPDQVLPDSQPEDPNPTLDAQVTAPADAAADDEAGHGCLPALGIGTVQVPPRTPVDVATAVHNALAYVGVKYGWNELCDRLACRAYGYVGSGYVSAKAHWQVMVAHGYAHPGDRCPPLGSFVFWNTGRPYGHVSLVVQADPVGCDPDAIEVTSNGVFDAATGNHGGVYLLSFARLDHMQLGGRGYLGWSPPICAGALLPAGTVHPAPSGR